MTTPVLVFTKKFMTGVYSDLHFICELTTDREENIYKCIPKYSGGNGTDMSFFASNSKAKFFDTLDENYLTGKTDKHGNWTREY